MDSYGYIKKRYYEVVTIAQLVEYLLSRSEALGSILRTA